jgi:integrase
MKRHQKTIGQRLLPSGNIQVFCKVHGTFYQQVFPPSSTVGERNAWRDRTIEQHGGVPLESGSLAADVERFLAKPEIAAMKYGRQYATALQAWIAALGPTRRRLGLTRDDLEAVIQTWLQTVSPVTVYHRRTPLLRLYAVLDGPNAPNPVKATTCPAQHRPVDRSVDYATIARILAAMADDRCLSRGIRQPSLAKLRATVIAYTGIPPAELMKLQAHHFDRHAGVVRMPWRDKGAGTPAHTRPLSAEGIAAFVALDAAHGWGPFAGEALAHSFKRAARRVLGPSTAIRLYDLRHSLGAELYRTTRDLATVGRLLGHVEGSSVTSRYAMGAHAEVDRAALAAVSAAWAVSEAKATAVPAGAPRLQKKLQAPRKLKQIKAVSHGS